MELSSFLKRLCEAQGVSGYETEVRRVIKEEFSKYADEVRVDKMGNVIALKKGTGEPRRRVMLAGHMDEIGLIITKIEKGFLRFSTVGGVDQRVLPGQEVMVHGHRDLLGVIGARPPHVVPKEEREKVIPLKELFIDVGLPPEEVEKVVRVGDLATIRREFVELKGGLVSAKAFDSRAAIAAISLCLRELSSERHAWDVYAVATVQEEVGLRGAITSAYGLAPDVAIAIDVGFGWAPGLSEEESIVLGKGPAIALGPNIHPYIHELLVQAAQELEIPYQLEPIPGFSGTDAWAIQVSREGVPTGLLSIPLRYMHTSVETLSLKDVERTGRLLVAFVKKLEQWELGG